MQPFVHFLNVIFYTSRCIIKGVCIKIFLTFILQEVFRQDLQLFCFSFSSVQRHVLPL